MFEANRRRYGAGFDDDGDGVAVLAALQCGVGSVSELQAQRVLAWFKFERDLCLALAVVEMLLVGGDDLSGWDEVGIDEDMEVSGSFVNRPRDLWPPSLPQMVKGGAVGGLFEANRRGYGAGFDDDGDGVAVLVAFQCGVGSVSELQAQGVLAWFNSSEISVWPLP